MTIEDQGRVKCALSSLIIWAEAVMEVSFSHLPPYLFELHASDIRHAKKALELIDAPSVLPDRDEVAT